MSEPNFLSISRVLLLHQKSIDRFGGTQGIRDRGLFESAINQPKHTFHYAHGDLFDIAAAHAFPIAEAQACLDGNKRTGVASALAFLELNGVSSNFDSLPLYEAMIAVAKKEISKAELA